MSNIKKILYDIETAKCELDYEVGTLISPDGTVIKEYTGSAHGIYIPEEERHLFEGAIFTHNHPSGRCFTTKDVVSAANMQVSEMRASTPQGTFFSLRATSEEVNRSIGKVMLEEKVGDVVEAANTYKQKGFNLTGEAIDSKIFDLIGEDVDKWLLENAAEFGYTYTKGVL